MIAFSWLTVLALGLSTLAPPAQSAPAANGLAPTPERLVADPSSPKELPTLFIAGDSTAASGDGVKQQGWGVPFAEYFDATKIKVVNHARGGRSSRTFIVEGLAEKLMAEVKPGDFVLIQFGHNDGGAINEEPPGSTQPLRARGSLPGVGEETQAIDNVVTKQPEVVHTYGWYLRKMIADVKARKAQPIVLSLTVRNKWSNGQVERYREHRTWAREVAQQAGVPFIDLTRIIADRYQVLGETKVATFFPQDHTHTATEGADLNAAAVVAGLKGLRKGPWSEFLSAKGMAVESDSIGWLNLPEPKDPALPSVVLIGDSTVRNGGGDGANGEWGWGHPIADWFAPSKINVVNLAIGGLSSRTFLTQGHWARALTLMKRGDFLIMQFGHNDNGALNDTSRARGTIKGVGEETEAIDNLLTQQPEVVHSYGWYLRKYIREAKERGITPIVCSLVPRKTWKEGRIVRAHDGYAGWAKQVAEQEGVAFIDLNEQVARRYEAMGEEKVNTLFADAHTHTSRAGAELNAAVVVEALRALPDHPLSRYLR